MGKKNITLALLLGSVFSCFSGPVTDLYMSDLFGRMPLHHEIRMSTDDCAMELLVPGASVDEREGPLRLTPLMVAAQCNKSKIINRLSQLGATLELVDAQGYHTALWYAIINNSQEAVKTLLECKANPDALCDSSGRTLITDAMSFSSETMGLLFKYGADLNYVDRNGRTIFDYALDFFETTDDKVALSFLLANGVVPTEEAQLRLTKLKKG